MELFCQIEYKYGQPSRNNLADWHIHLKYISNQDRTQNTNDDNTCFNFGIAVVVVIPYYHLQYGQCMRDAFMEEPPF